MLPLTLTPRSLNKQLEGCERDLFIYCHWFPVINDVSRLLMFFEHGILKSASSAQPNLINVSSFVKYIIHYCSAFKGSL